MRRMIALMMAMLASPAGLRAEPTRIPLQPGLLLVYMGADPQSFADHPAGDFQRIASVDAVSSEMLTLGLQFTDYTSDPALQRRYKAVKQVRQADMEAGHRLLFRFLAGDPDNIPGSTIFHASKAMVGELEDSKRSAVVFADGPAAEGGGLFSATSRKYYRGDLEVVGPVVMFDVLINGEKVAIPTVHAHGVLTVANLFYDVDFWWSTDRDNPLLVRYQQKEGNWVQLVRADMPIARPDGRAAAKPAAAPDPPAALGKPAAPGPAPTTAPAPSSPAAVETIDTKLAGSKCRAEMQGIYFDTGSATLLPASTPALDDVGALIAHHPDWSVTIEGHTDNVGTAAYNLDLSNRRASAVKEALAARSGAAALNLTMAGFGDTRPIDDNATVVGRARNRRVELARKCT